MWITNDFVTGALGFPEAEALDEKIAGKIAAYRENGDDVLFTFDTHTPEYLRSREGRYLPVPHCIRGTQGHMLYGKVGQSVDTEDWCFVKYTFGSDALFDFLQKNRYSSIELVGVVTEYLCYFQCGAGKNSTAGDGCDGGCLLLCVQ